MKVFNSLTVGFVEEPYALGAYEAGLVEFEPGEVSPPHSHQLHEIHYIVDGEAKLRVGKRNYTIRGGDLFFAKAGDIHSQYYVRKTTFCYCTLAVSWWSKLMEDESDNHQPPLQQKNIRRIVEMTSQVFPADQRVRSDIEAFFHQIRLNGTLDVLKDRTLFKKMVIGFTHSWLKNKDDLEQRKKIFEDTVDSQTRLIIRQSISEVKSGFAGPISLADIAKKACLSQRHFERLFKTATGYSPSDYLLEQRLEKALVLLKESDEKIDAIIRKSGFRNRTHFFTFFMKRTGLTPDNFRKNIRASVNNTQFNYGIDSCYR